MSPLPGAVELAVAAGVVAVAAVAGGVRSHAPGTGAPRDARGAPGAPVRAAGRPAPWKAAAPAARATRAPRGWWGASGSRGPVRPRDRHSQRRAGRRDLVMEGARWAQRADLSPLLRAPGTPGRLVLGDPPGTAFGLLGGQRRCVVSAEPLQSLAVIGPTQSGKTTALAVPAILGWDGPVLAASVKTDLVRDTLAWRRSLGRVWCFDPAGTTGLPQSEWSPLVAAGTWAGARRVASELTSVTRAEGTTADGEFWYATAAKLLAPLLFAAASADRSMHDVVRWVDTQDAEEVTDILDAAGVPEAMQAARATWLRDERTRSSVYTTAETVLEPFAEPGLVIASQAGPGLPGPARWHEAAPAAMPSDGALPRDPAPPVPSLFDTPPLGTPAAVPAPGDRIDPEAFLDGQHSLYVCAPAHDQRRLRAVFAALVEQVLHAAFARSSKLGRPLDPPLLVVLDEAANIAPLRDLDGLAATCAGHGVQLVTVWQDLAQVRARFGERAATVVNNHRAKVFLPGIADPATLDFAGHLAGEREITVPSTTFGVRGERTLTTTRQVRPLLPADALRRLPPGNAVLLYGSLPPARLGLRPWFADPCLASPRSGSGAKRPPA